MMDEVKAEDSTQEEWDQFTRTVLGEKTTEEQLEVDARIKNLADDKTVLNYANIHKKLVMPTIGFHVMYTPLTMEDRVSIHQILDPNLEVQRDKRNRKKVELILKKANDGVFTEEMIAGFAANLVDTILMRYDEEEDVHFLLRLIRKEWRGSRLTSTPNKPSS